MMPMEVAYFAFLYLDNRPDASMVTPRSPCNRGWVGHNLHYKRCD